MLEKWSKIYHKQDPRVFFQESCNSRVDDEVKRPCVTFAPNFVDLRNNFVPRPPYVVRHKSTTDLRRQIYFRTGAQIND